MNRENVRIIRYAMENSLVTLSFTTEDLPNNLLPLQNALDTLTLNQLELIIVRSLFDLIHNSNRIYQRHELLNFELQFLNQVHAQAIIIRRFDVENDVFLEYEWF